MRKYKQTEKDRKEKRNGKWIMQSSKYPAQMPTESKLEYIDGQRGNPSRYSMGGYYGDNIKEIDDECRENERTMKSNRSKSRF